MIKIRNSITGKIILEVETLQDADLQNADLQNADLRDADLQDANLQYANLQDANLQWADLRGATLDFSCFPLWCGSFNMIVDIKIVYQLLYHICKLKCNDKVFKTIVKLIKPFADKFHRVDECGTIKLHKTTSQILRG